MLREVFSKRAEARRLSKLREKRKETRKRQPSMILGSISGRLRIGLDVKR